MATTWLNSTRVTRRVHALDMVWHIYIICFEIFISLASQSKITQALSNTGVLICTKRRVTVHRRPRARHDELHVWFVIRCPGGHPTDQYVMLRSADARVLPALRCAPLWFGLLQRTHIRAAVGYYTLAVWTLFHDASEWLCAITCWLYFFLSTLLVFLP